MTSSEHPSPALRAFVRARIGGEPVGTTATSELMLQTVTKAASAAGGLVDSPALGVPAAKPVTRPLRGTSVALHLLSNTLGQRGITRGLGLLVLALGGSLVAISLISSVPAWLASAGFAILLGGLAYTALVTGELALTLVLATPVVPLLVWSGAQHQNDPDPGPSRMVQIALIAMIIVTALLMGSVRTPQTPPTVRASAKGLGHTLLALTGLVALVILGWFAVWALRASSGWLHTSMTVIAWLAALALALVSWYAVVRAGRLAARVQTGTEPGWPSDRMARASRGSVSAAWAWLFGSVYGCLALGLVAVRRWGPQDEPWQSDPVLRSLLPWFVLLAVLCFLAALLMARLPKPRRAPTRTTVVT